MTTDVWRARAEAWAQVDPDPETRATLEAMLASGDAEALQDHFATTLDFGTGGMRGPMGPGSARMNRVMVRRVTAGLADTLLAAHADATTRGVALAYDARRNSAVFARDAARVLAGRGFRVFLAPRPTPTPLLSFATVHLGAVAGVIVTASHNPPADNGYKVFWETGAQIIAPIDGQVRDAMAAVPWDEAVPPWDAIADRIGSWPATLVEAYDARVAALRVMPATGARIVYTPVHGVGWQDVSRVLSQAGHTDVHVVPSQAKPDGSFPTVTFPNPEEPGVLDASKALADDVSADVILANDPDADRLAAAVHDGEHWVQLSGNDLGVVIADAILRHTEVRPTDLVVTTVVSTALLGRLAAEAGVQYAETLTGFKWIADAALHHEAEGGRFLFGFEESIGYTLGDVVRDKDGVSAALFVADLASAAKAKGRTLRDLLHDIFRRHGLHQSHQHAVRLPGTDGAARIQAAMATLRETPPTALAGVQVERRVDVQRGEDVAADGTVVPVDLPTSNVLAFHLVGGHRVLVRPSGTEPKIKFYVEAVVPWSDDVPVETLTARADAQIQALLDDVLSASGL